LALKYEDQDIDSSQAGIGLTLRRSFNTGFGVVVPYIGGELLHAWGDSEVVKYSYAFALSGSDPSFASVTDDPDSAYGVATVGLSTQFARNLSVFVQYEGLIGLSNTTAGMGTIGIRGTF
jgi:outer membrane autotransporter protein